MTLNISCWTLYLEDGKEETTRNRPGKDKVEKARLMCGEGGQELSPWVTSRDVTGLVITFHKQRATAWTRKITVIHGYQSPTGLCFLNHLLWVHIARVVHGCACAPLHVSMLQRSFSFQCERQSVGHMVVFGRLPPEWTPRQSLMPPPEVWDHVCTRDVAKRTEKNAQTSVCVCVCVTTCACVSAYVCKHVCEADGRKERN